MFNERYAFSKTVILNNCHQERTGNYAETALHGNKKVWSTLRLKLRKQKSLPFR